MNLVIDQGNTFCKLAVYSDEELLYLEEKRTLGIADLQCLLDKYPMISSAIYSTVAMRDEVVMAFLKSRLAYLLELDTACQLPFTMAYNRCEIGSDRLAAVSAGIDLSGKEKELLIIDIGTAITIERISKGHFLGGNISPGLKIRLKGLNQFTARLPMVELDSELGWGENTETAIARGVLQGVVYEIKVYIEEVSNISSELDVYITGGYANLIASKLDETVILREDLVLYGLNNILEYNKLC